MLDQIGDVFRRNGVDGCIVVKCHSSTTPIVWNSQRAETRFRPASTFKILNALIALEVGAIDPHEELDWDRTQTWNDSLQHTFNLHGAFKASAGWFFKILAGRIGIQSYRKYLPLCGYGNCNCGDIVENFWIKGPLLISPIEQVTFLEKLSAAQLPFTSKNVSTVLDMMLLDSSPGITLRAKTGFIDESENYGWIVGYREEKSHFNTFATHIDIPNINLLPSRRMIAEECLDLVRDLG